MGHLLKVLMVVSIISASPAKLAFAEDKEVKDTWAENTAISEQHLKNFFTQERCYANENNFLGCIEAINDLFHSSDTPLTLTNTVTEKFASSKEVVKVIERLKLQKFSYTQDKTKTIAVLLKESQDQQRLSNATWKVVYKKTLNAQLSIPRILDEALHARNSKYKAAALASAINMYLVNAVDAHTSIWPVKQMNEARAKNEDSFTGVGMQLIKKNEQMVLKPLANSPALAGGIRYQDVLTHVDGASVDKKGYEETRNLIVGKENTNVALTVLRSGKKMVFNITRKKIVTENLVGHIYLDHRTKSKTGVITLHSFMQNGVCAGFIDIAKKMHAAGAQSLILDVRSNGGGSLPEVLCMAGAFVEQNKTLLINQDPKTGKVQDVMKNIPIPNGYLLSRGAELYNLYGKPLVIMINAGSASASELLPGALQAHGRVVTVGVKSFGKGSMQKTGEDLDVVGLENIRGVGASNTVSRFHFADGKSNQLVGIEPDFEAYPTPNPTEEEMLAQREADLFPNAIRASTPPSGISQLAKQRISTCMLTGGGPKAEYWAEEKTALGGDYQMSTALAVSRCL